MEAMRPPAWIELTERAGASYLDFSVNTNPLGIPESVRQGLPEIAAVAEFYPDPDCRRLRAMLADKYGVSAEAVLCGNGADDLLYRLVLALRPKRALIVEPAYEEYGRALRLAGCEVLHCPLRQEALFAPDEAVLAHLHDVDMVFLCNPNNPTGRTAAAPVLRRIAEVCARRDIFLVVDECFLEFLPDWERRTLKRSAAGSQRLVVLDAFTKTYALAGFRLGFCISGNPKLLEAMRACGQAFGVSTPAQLAGICALQEPAYWERTYALLAAERPWLSEKLRELGFTVVPSQTNYLLFWSEAADLREALLARGVKVRDCSRFYGLGTRYCRAAVRTHAENEALIAALQNLPIK